MDRARVTTAVFTIIFIAIAAIEPIAPAKAEKAEQAFTQWPKPCRRDLGRLCHDMAKDEDKTILTCLQDNQDKLGRACRKLLQSYGHVPETTAGTRR
jgi:hypothetical protein